MIFSD